MQVLGKVPKKERKPKNPRSSLAQYPSAHVGAMSDPGLLQNKLKPRLMEGTVKEKVTGSPFLHQLRMLMMYMPSLLIVLTNKQKTLLL